MGRCGRKLPKHTILFYSLGSNDHPKLREKSCKLKVIPRPNFRYRLICNLQEKEWSLEGIQISNDINYNFLGTDSRTIFTKMWYEGKYFFFQQIPSGLTYQFPFKNSEIPHKMLLFVGCFLFVWWFSHQRNDGKTEDLWGRTPRYPVAPVTPQPAS